MRFLLCRDDKFTILKKRRHVSVDNYGICNIIKYIGNRHIKGDFDAEKAGDERV